MGAVTQAAAMQAAAIARNSVKLEYGARLSKPRPRAPGKWYNEKKEICVDELCVRFEAV
jgi:hypothetical protein